jgi:GTP-binding protein Era
MRSGFVSIVGRPNVGKSTLLNSIIDRKISITSKVSGTTRNIIEGIYTKDDVQIIFVDTPGISKPINKLGKVLNKQAYALTKDVDAILLVVDIESGIGKGDKYLMENVLNNDIPVILVINKIDRVTNEVLIKAINEYKDCHFAEIVPISALTDDNISHLVQVIKKYLKDDIKYYEDDIFTNNSAKFMASEIVREKLLQNTKEEIPHSITCYTSNLDTKKDIVEISVDIIVDRKGIKKIIIGSGGEMIKKIGILARRDLEEMFGKKVFLDLYVKVIENWKDKEKYLKELGFFDNE